MYAAMKENQQGQHVASDLRDPKNLTINQQKLSRGLEGTQERFLSYPQSMPHDHCVVGRSYECAVYRLFLYGPVALAGISRLRHC